MLPPTAETVPLAGAVTPEIVSGSPSGSLSFVSTLTVTGWPDAVVAASSTATGGRLGCASTVTVTAAVLVPPWPSLIEYVNRSVPENPAAGVYVTALPATVAVPLAGGVTPLIAKTSRSGSMSLASTSTLTGCANAVVAMSSTATGG